MAMDVTGETSLNSKGFVNLSFRQPFGVGAAIVPWNGPTFMLVNKIGPGLVAGNTMVVKSSEKSPLSALVIARIANEVGLPNGVLNILSGFGFPCGDAIARHMDIRIISFTGSVATGKAIKKASAESNLKKVTLELGGKNPLVIFDDADLQQAIPAAAASVVANSGQGCILTSRIYIHQNLAEPFIENVKQAMTMIAGAVNDPTEKTTRGPQADKTQFDKIMGYFQYAKDHDIQLRLGGDRARPKGYFVEPTIYTNVSEDARIMKEEIFGPVVCINTFVDEEEVVKRANDTEFGLYASVFTRDISRALRVAKQLEAGSVGINVAATTKLDMPMGGWKQSGEGREFSKHAWEEWTEIKSVFVKL
jgi:aldehyde dehydrogenase (NAD+)